MDAERGDVVLVLGGTGHVGRRVVAALIERDVPVRVLTRRPEAARALLGDGPEIHTGDLCDPDPDPALLAEVRGIVVAVSAMALRTFRRAREIEHDAVLAFLRHARAAGIRRVVLISVYDIDLDVATRLEIEGGSIKHDLEHALRDMDLDWTVLGQPPSMDLFFALIRGGRVLVVPGGGPPGLPTIAVRDTGRIAAEAVLRDDLGGRRFRLAGPDAPSFPEAARRIGAVWGRHLPVLAPPLFVPATLRRLLGLVRERSEWAGFAWTLLGYILLMNVFPKGLVEQAAADHRLLRETFSFTPTTLEDEARNRLQTVRAGGRPRFGPLDVLLVVLEVLLSAGAWPAGISFVLQPDGSGLGMTVEETLGHSPFDSFLLPGVILILANGVWPLVVAGAALSRARWAPLGHLAVGLVLLGWMTGQVAMLGWTHWLQTTYMLLGAVIALLGGWRVQRSRATPTLENPR